MYACILHVLSVRLYRKRCSALIIFGTQCGKVYQSLFIQLFFDRKLNLLIANYDGCRYNGYHNSAESEKYNNQTL